MSMLDPNSARHDFDMGRASRRILRTYPSWQHQVAENKRQARRLSRRAAQRMIKEELQALETA